MTFPQFDLSIEAGPDHIQAILVFPSHGVQVNDHFLGQRYQQPLVPEFLASHKAQNKSYICY